MNQPPYIVTDVCADMVTAVSVALARPVYFYFGYVKELDESLQELSGSPAYNGMKFPLVWLAEPFTISSSDVGMYGVIDELRFFIMTGSEKNWKSTERKANNFIPTIWPIRDELKEQMIRSKPFAWYPQQGWKFTDRYYWGESQQNVLNDVVDITECRFQNVKIHNNKNCIT